MYRQLFCNCWKILLLVTLIFVFLFASRHLRYAAEKQFALPKVSHATRIHLKSTKKTTIPPKLDKDFCVFSQSCKIPRLNPFSEDIMKLYKPPKFIKCTNQADLLEVQFDRSKKQYSIHINDHLKDLIPDKLNFGCTYREIVRGNNDSMSLIYKPIYFKQDWLVPRHMLGLIVECHELSNVSRIIQRDAFAFVQYPMNRNDKMDVKRTRTHPNIILLGIDGMSHTNFKRTMPLTANFVNQPGWYSMLGYNKIGDNTLPNILTLLTGRAMWNLHCDVFTPGCLDAITYLWDHFRSAGYLTTYAEDLASLNTFNYLNYGFNRQPVDYYLYPFSMAIEDAMDTKEYFGWNYCVGRKQSYRYVLDYGLQLIQRFIKETPKPLFSFLWMNSFSHDDFSGPASVDADFLRYLERYKELGLFDRSIVVLLSDHGQRFGPLMELPTSFLEERLPMLHIYLPKWYRQKNPEVANALDLNRNRLSSPYDLHLTFKDIIGRLRPNLRFGDTSCKSCQSLLQTLPANRTCSQAKILNYWCACEPHKQVPITDELRDLARLIVYRINLYLVKTNYEKKCYHLGLRKLLQAEIRQHIDATGREVNSPDGFVTYRFKFTTKPNGGLFYGTLSFSSTQNNAIVREEFITRLNSYRNDSYCVQNPTAKKFCSCLKNQDRDTLLEN